MKYSEIRLQKLLKIDVSNSKLHIFFNVDFYEKELGKYTNKCTECKKHCKQFYWILSINCPKCESKK